jgi:hypothetical protein
MPPQPVEKRSDVVSAQFTLKMSQDWTIPLGGGYHNNELTLEVRDANGDYYEVSPDISGHAGLLAKLLRRIAATNGKPGWKFDADWYPNAKAGKITGPT